MSEIANINNINTDLTRPADSTEPSDWEAEKDKWGGILNKTTFSQIDDNFSIVKQVLYAHDEAISEGTDFVAIRDYILSDMITNGITAGIVYQSETGEIEINNNIDRHINILGVNYTIREYFKKDAENKWRHYFLDNNNVEN